MTKLLDPAIGITPRLALSLRRMRDDYTGPLIRIRCGSVEMDLGCEEDSDELNIGAAVAFASSQGVNWPDVRVVRWYDQAPDGNHAEQVDPAKQPRLAMYDDGEMGRRVGIYFSWGANPHGLGNIEWLKASKPYACSIYCGMVLSGQLDAREPTPYQHRAFVMGTANDASTYWRVGFSRSGWGPPYVWNAAIGARYPSSAAVSLAEQYEVPFTLSYRATDGGTYLSYYKERPWPDGYLDRPISDWVSETYYIGRSFQNNDSGNFIGWMFEVLQTAPLTEDQRFLAAADQAVACNTRRTAALTPIPFY